MSDSFGSDFISIVDEETNEEFELEIVDTMTYNEKSYLLLLPADMDENDEDYGFIILRSDTDENGDVILDSVDDDAELEEVYERFMALLEEEDEEEEE